ncbi:MAG TPA: type I-E CRISPR-associated protein Cas5/CasD [Fimbriiglobus sp.]|nr:type I-E CRISPR-associated protein Cas5/CasD [Fimbriiglobus sp.]
MSVLLLRLAGPMQSWGTQSRFTHRDAGTEPSRSGVVGLLCAALGRSRTEPLDDFTALRMAVRVDREGRLMRDYHTAGGEHRPGAVLGDQPDGRNKGKPRPYGVPKADGSGVGTVVSHRFYLADADFLVGLEGPDVNFLSLLHNALRSPVWPMYLGRKSFLPALPPAVGVADGNLSPVLATFPWRRRVPEEAPPNRLRVVEEVEFGQGEPRDDVPLSFADRRFAVRHVRVRHLEAPPPLLDPDQDAPPCS